MNWKCLIAICALKTLAGCSMAMAAPLGPSVEVATAVLDNYLANDPALVGCITREQLMADAEAFGDPPLPMDVPDRPLAEDNEQRVKRLRALVSAGVLSETPHMTEESSVARFTFTSAGRRSLRGENNNCLRYGDPYVHGIYGISPKGPGHARVIYELDFGDIKPWATNDLVITHLLKHLAEKKSGRLKDVAMFSLVDKHWEFQVTRDDDEPTIYRGPEHTEATEPSLLRRIFAKALTALDAVKPFGLSVILMVLGHFGLAALRQFNPVAAGVGHLVVTAAVFTLSVVVLYLLSQYDSNSGSIFYQRSMKIILVIFGIALTAYTLFGLWWGHSMMTHAFEAATGSTISVRLGMIVAGVVALCVAGGWIGAIRHPGFVDAIGGKPGSEFLLGAQTARKQNNKAISRLQHGTTQAKRHQRRPAKKTVITGPGPKLRQRKQPAPARDRLSAGTREPQDSD